MYLSAPSNTKHQHNISVIIVFINWENPFPFIMHINIEISNFEFKCEVLIIDKYDELDLELIGSDLGAPKESIWAVGLGYT